MKPLDCAPWKELLLALATSGGPTPPSEERVPVEIEVDEVTGATLALSPDGRTLYFPVLGDLVALPVEGGEAVQLTLGPAYDADPEATADGRALEFTSDREGGALAAWRLDLESRAITRIEDPDAAARLQRRGLASGVSFARWKPREDESIVASFADPELALIRVARREGTQLAGDSLVVFRVDTGEELARERVGPSRQETWECRPAFGAGVVYYVEDGHLVAFDAAGRTRRSLPFHARLRHLLPKHGADRRQAPRWDELDPVRRQGVGAIAPAPDGDAIAFELDGELWLAEGDAPPRRLATAEARLPRFTLDGATIRFVRGDELFSVARDGGAIERVVKLPRGVAAYDADATRALALGGSFGASSLELHDLAQSRSKRLIRAAGNWSLSPDFGAAGELVVTLERSGAGAQLFALDEEGRATPLTALDRPPQQGRLSADGRFLAFLRDGKAWIGARPPREAGASAPLSESDVHALGGTGAHALLFGADSDRLYVARGPEVEAYDCTKREVVARFDLTVNTPRPPLAPPLVLRHASVVDVERGVVLPDQRIELAREKIVRVVAESEAPAIPDGVATLDASGRFVIPGLVDMHVHGPGPFFASLAAFGVTRCRDTGGTWPGSWADDERVVLGADVGPRLLLAGEIFEGAHPIWGDAFHVCESSDEAIALLVDRAARGIDLVKVYPTLPRAIRAPLLERARALGLPSTGHADHLRLIVGEIEDGLTCFEHLPPALLHSDVMKLMAAAGMAWCPTLCVMGGGDWKLRNSPAERDAPRFRKSVAQASLEQARAGAFYQWSSDANLAALLDERCRMVARAAGFGIPILVGTDAPNANCFHGPGTHWEMEFLVRGGLSPAQALRCATRTPAEVYGLDEGRIAAGAAADLVLLRADPLAEVRATQSIETVILRGRALTPEQILGDGVRGY